MDTHTQPKKWHPQKTWGARIITAALICYFIFEKPSEPNNDIAAVFMLAMGVGIVMTIIGAVKDHGALRTGIWAAIFGALLVVLMILIDRASSGYTTVVAFGETAGGYGVLLLLAGIVMMVVGLIRRGQSRVHSM